MIRSVFGICEFIGMKQYINHDVFSPLIEQNLFGEQLKSFGVLCVVNYR